MTRDTDADADADAPRPDGHPPREDRAPRGRRPYRSPRLEDLGRLAEVTQFGGSEIVDSGSGLGQAF
jgi:hypothetical protein